MTQPTTPEVSSALMELPEDVVEKMCEAMYPRWALHSRQFRRSARIDRDTAKTELRAALKALSDSGFRICAESKSETRDQVFSGSQWHDISTAPKDGTEFQAWFDNPNGYSAWDPRCRYEPDTEALQYWGRTDYDQDGWVTVDRARVTHWMPLPTPPGDTEKSIENPSPLSPALAVARNEGLEEGAALCDAEQAKRKHQSDEAYKGSWNWGDPKEARKSQALMSIAAMDLAKQIRALKT